MYPRTTITIINNNLFFMVKVYQSSRTFERISFIEAKFQSGLSIAEVEHLVKELYNIYYMLSDYNLLPSEIHTTNFT